MTRSKSEKIYIEGVVRKIYIKSRPYYSGVPNRRGGRLVIHPKHALWALTETDNGNTLKVHVITQPGESGKRVSSILEKEYTPILMGKRIRFYPGDIPGVYFFDKLVEEK